MYLSRFNLEVVALSSRDEIDRGLCGVKIEADGSTVGGNGKVFLIVSGITYADKLKFKVGDDHGAAVLLSNEIVEQTLKRLPQDIAGKHIQLIVKDSRVGFGWVDIKGDPSLSATKPKEQPYPDYKAVASDIAKGVESRICVNRKDLLKLLQVIDIACPDKSGMSPVFIEAGPKGLLVRALNSETGQRAIGAIRVYDTRGQWMIYSAWERLLLNVKAVVRRVIS